MSAIDRESEGELKDLYVDVGYTIIDDVLSLPERMPNIYRRLTNWNQHKSVIIQMF